MQELAACDAIEATAILVRLFPSIFEPKESVMRQLGKETILPRRSSCM